MNIKKYLNRIGYDGKLEPTLEVLNQLQEAHLLNVPFENLDIHRGIPIVLNTDKIYKKIVEDNRGGFCYELNGLFYELLRFIGFEAKRISGRVFDKEKGFGKEYDHLAILVKLNGSAYLTDVGFGEFVFHPLLFELGKIQQDKRGDFTINKFDDSYFIINKLEAEKTIPQYIFTPIPRAYREFEEMSLYHQTSPHSHFTHKKFVGIPTQNGRITLVGNKLKKIENGVVNERIIYDDEFDELLVKYFKIKKSFPSGKNR